MSDYTQALRDLMQPLAMTSFKQLSRKADVSQQQVRQLRKGKIAQLRLKTLLKLSQTLQITLSELLTTFSAVQWQQDTPLQLQTQLAALQQEYQQLQQQSLQQQQQLQQQFQRDVLQALESWLLYWSAAAKAARNDPQFPAQRLLTLVRPLEQLLQDWGVQTLAEVGTEVAYDPHCHQLIEGMAQPGDRVQIRYSGYYHQDKLLFRAKVSPVIPQDLP
jgi:molecular chaperone GrpE (heat shock protein)